MEFKEVYDKYKEQIVETPKPPEIVEVMEELEVKQNPNEELLSDEILASEWLGLDYTGLTAQEKIDYAKLYNQAKELYGDPRKALRRIETELGSLRLGDTRIGRLKRYFKIQGTIKSAYNELQDI